MLNPVAASNGCDVRVSYRADGVVAVLVGSMDRTSAPHVERELQALVMSPLSVLTLDLSRVASIDRVGQRVLVELRRLAADIGTSISILGPDATIEPLGTADRHLLRTRPRPSRSRKVDDAMHQIT